MTIVIDSTKPKARKTHSCDLCQRFIQPGERYLRMRLNHEGSLYAENRCAHCQALVKELLARDPDAEGFIYDDGLPEVGDWAFDVQLHAARAAYLNHWETGTPGALCDPEELAFMLALGRLDASTGDTSSFETTPDVLPGKDD